jgi:hypothetical protein
VAASLVASRARGVPEAGQPDADGAAIDRAQLFAADAAAEADAALPRDAPARPLGASEGAGIDPRVAEALRSAPPRPGLPPPYPGHDPAMEAAEIIRNRVRRFPLFRDATPLGTWDVDEARVWRIRPSGACLAELRSLGLRARPWEPDPAADAGTLPDLMATPTAVVPRSRIGGVYFSVFERDLLVSCELAARLPAIAQVLADQGVESVTIASAHRSEPRTSFHTMGLALDIAAFRVGRRLAGPEGDLSQRLLVKTDFLETPDRPTCDPGLLGPESPLGGNERGRKLLAIACALFDSGLLSSVLTPNYNKGHRDHFHIDIRPDDPRAFLR